MRVVVTGATGNVGTSVVESLAEHPEIDEIVALARRNPEWRSPKVTFVADDIRSRRLVDHFRGASVLVHLAWAFQPTHDPIKTWDTNVMGSIGVFEAAAAAGVSALVYASSVGAYSPGPGEHVDESWPTHSLPVAAYGREKAYLERYLDAFELRHPEMRVVRLRPSFTFKRESASEQRRIFAGPLVPRVLMRPGRLRVLPLPPGLRFQALHTADAAQAYRLAVTSDARGAFNVAAEPVIDGSALATLFGARTVPVPPTALRMALAGAWRLRLAPADEALLALFLQLPTLDTSRIRRELGWEPARSGVDALREMLEGLADGAGAATEPLRPDRKLPADHEH
ncbi:NAD-dependent epimerase/dehydratase family protein [Actinobacteria bacterium YIM 96077]|uniref:NAD-dependent epimerase n=1 Tax=Phytoactinopolyspora halophila TaxID=1981511 RepID=A0A329QPA7_9ACTN|nr:NAD-dependent epimerase/dehydratase family protein [Phytoactinopolyspora halophila]AYY14540.1 NAD-dependent epimerase/dehydratase family protein [Actinobacteria bacterium YIM 96077]RAW14083.1 NAD-dependent epimerase [Phytoactinopolyspora halophila]